MTADNPMNRNAPANNHAREGNNVTEPIKEQLELRAFVKLLGELQSKGKITGQQFRENRELWVHQQPNDREVLVWRLKQVLNTETKPEVTRSQTFQKRRRM